MPHTADFHKIAETISQSDIDAFFRSAAPDDVKEQVRRAADEATKKRLVAGYLIRTNQIKPERLNPKLQKTTIKAPTKAVTKKRPTKKRPG